MTISNKISPILRFPKFRKGFDWNMDKFYDLFSILSNNTLSRSELSYGAGSVYNIHYGDVLIKFNEYLDVAKEDLPYINDKTKADKYKVAHLKDGDVVIADTAEDETAGKCTEVTNVGDTIVVSGLHTIPCRPQKEFAQAYLGYYMNSTMFHDRLLPIMQGAKVTSIPKASLQNILLVYPQDLEEQQKIAECLSSIDEEISAIKEKIEQLKVHKKGLMQKLFPIAEKFVPELRFPEFEKDWEWKEMSIANCCDVFTGGEAPKNISKEHNNIMKYPIYANGKDVYGYTDSYRIDKDAVCISSIGANTGAIFYYRAFFTPIIRLKVVIPKDNTVQTPYLYYFLTTRKIKGKKDAGIPNLNANDIKIVLIMYPSSPVEQQKIAECLSSIDELISLYENKVTLLEQHKKGLMQQLFPKL